MLNPLYFGCEHDHLHTLELAGGYELPGFLNIRDLANKALERIFKTRKADVDPDLFEITYRVLEESINVGAGKIEYGKPNYALVQQLKDSAAIFSSAKTLQQGKELAALITRPDGKYRGWDEFLPLAKSVDENYNEHWLKVEHSTAIRKARSAVDWQSYVENADLYPNLKYLPSKAATPSEEHKVYWHIIKPIVDEFWQKHLPPSRYNCQCGSEPTDEEPTAGEIKGVFDPSPGLDNNPGMTGQLFGENHPYISNLTPEELKYVTKKAKQYVTRGDEKRRRSG